MGITFNLYRNADGSLDGSYPAGDKPAPSWQLPTANYVNTGMPMNLVFPRPEAASWSYAKNAYTGVKWNIPIGIQGGAWPFNFEVTDNGGATGVSIGNFLLGVIDGPTGKTTYSVTDDYGVLSWDNPVAGSYTITVRVTDQTGATLDVAVSLTVGTSGWLFVDPVSGNDSTGDGSIGNPFASLVPLHNDSSATATYANHRVYLRSGVIPLGDMATNAGTYRVESNKVPCQYIGYPDETPVLEWDAGWFHVWATNDFLIKDIECRYKSTYLPSGGPIYKFLVDNGGDRIALIGNNFTNFDGSPVNSGAGNSSIIYTTGPTKNHLFVSRCSQTNKTGTFTSCYQIADSLFEYHRVHNATTGTHDGSARRFIYLKDSPSTTTIRGCSMWENITWDSGDLDNYGCVGLGGQDGAQDVEICYSFLDHPANPASLRAGAIYNWGLNAVSALIQNVYVYRNSLKKGIKWEGDNHTNMADGTEVHQKNTFSDGVEETDARVSNVDNLTGVASLDGNHLLTGSYRTANLGTHGAEVAK